MEETFLQRLFRKYLDETISPAELSQLYTLINNEYDPAALDEVLKDAFSDPSFAAPEGDHDPREVFAGLVATIRERKKIYRLPWGRIAAAACIALLAGIMTWLWVGRPAKPNIVKAPPMHQDIAPGHDGAVLTLANGKQIVLDSMHNGALAVQGNVTITKLSNGQLSYTSTTANPAGVFYNKLSTPRARKTMVVLADGTEVWMNAASSIRYPTAFTGKERIVEVSGEAYFEVSQNASMPFIVKREGTDQRIEVLGTSFNMNAYDDEDTMRTTLLQGSVRVIKGSASIVLRPGEQAAAGRGGKDLRLIRDADIEEVIAWKNGRFQFSNMDLRTIMRQLARWYDVDVAFEGEVPDIRIGGFLHKDVNLSTVLEFLKNNGVRFKLEGRRIIVLK